MDVTALSDSLQPRGTGKDYNTSIISIEEQLLSCLLGLIRPMIAVHLSQSARTEINITVLTGDEGSNLISALNKFFKAGVLAAIQQMGNATGNPILEGPSDKQTFISDGTESIPQTPSKKSKKDKNASKPSSTESIMIKSPNMKSDRSVARPSIPLEVQPTELELITQRQTRAHVFNNMPIRMLEFDANGSNIKLIEREDIFSILTSRIQKKYASPGFQQDWDNALALQDIDDVWLMHRSNRMNEVVTDAVSEISSYAILSHTWIRESPGEVVYSTWDRRLSNHRGWTKVENFCRVAAHDHKMTLGWIDSSCINKDSSSELDESIRSMYKWYRGSHICITYLSETDALGDGAHDAWFTRGWTLQELLAPRNAKFYNKRWEALGVIEDDAIQSLTTDETTITKKEMDLCRTGNAKDIPLGRIMQMASQRQVTRAEDSAYSLLGLLDVNISVAYGEGADVAFHRLCQELLVTRKHVFDLFNRQYDHGDSLVPPSLKRYLYRLTNFDNVESTTQLDCYQPPEPVTFTHLGIRCQWLLLPALGFRKGTSAQGYDAKGQYSGQYSSTIVLESGVIRSCVFNLLDIRLYGNNTVYVHPPSDKFITRQPTLAVPTFSLRENVIILPENMMGISMYSTDKPGKVHTGSKMHIMPQGTPRCFTLINSTGGPREIPKQDLERHGMQLVTLYL